MQSQPTFTAAAAVTATSPDSDVHGGGWLESSLDLHAGLSVQEDLDMALFDLYAFAATLPTQQPSLH